MTMADMTSGQAPQTPPGGPAAGSPRADQPQRRVFTAAYKLRIIAECEALTRHGERAALLRREGLYDSHLRKWIAAKNAGKLGTRENPTPPPPGTGGETGKHHAGEIARLKAENARLTGELATTKAVLDVVGKTHALLELLSESADTPAPRT